jgi:hypothetical protein
MGPQGPPGILRSAFATGSIGIVATNSSWVFAGPTTTLSLTNGDKVFVSVSGAVGTTTSSVMFDYSSAYSFNGGAVTAVNGGNYMTVNATSANGIQPYSVSQIFTATQTGTYTIGFGVRNRGAGPLNNCDWAFVSVLVFN